MRITGVTADLIQLALKGREQGLKCDFAPGSVLFTGGGMKGFKDAPDDWEDAAAGTSSASTASPASTR